jgi:hypothetical protein
MQVCKEILERRIVNELKIEPIFLTVKKILINIIIIVLYLRVTPTKLNSMVGVRERTIPTERPPLIGEVIANF